MSAPIFGLLLVGGKSERMGRDKALLSYGGERTQLERSASLLSAVCKKTFISLRREQHFDLPPGTDVIYDSVDEVAGPLCGILSAMAAHPEANWLVVACDLPKLKKETLQRLVSSYHLHSENLIAYKSKHGDLPEPLCAIYPSGKGGELLALAREIGRFSIRELLIIKKARLIDQDDPESLININTNEEYEAILDRQ
ncbi:MAG: molybdenum cofactor guanylyltransferase [Verrucomicrobiota bacterium]